MPHRTRRREPDLIGGTPPYEAAFDVWQRRKWLAIATFLVAAAVAITVARSLPDLYRATATVLVARQQVSEAFVRPSVTAELETRIQTIHQEIMSRARLGQVIARLDPYPDLRNEVPFDAIVQQMRRDIQLELKGVEQMTGRAATIAFAVSYTGRDPDTAARVANTLASLYVEENTRRREQQASQTAAFLKEQLDAIRRELDGQEQRTREYQSRYTSELPQQLGANLAALERLNTQLRLNGEYQLRAIERRERLERQLLEAGAAGASSTAPEPVAQLAARRRELSDLRKQYSDKHPDVIRLAAQVAGLERQVAALPAEATSPAASKGPGKTASESLAEIESELASLNEQEAFLRQAIAEYEARVENAPKRQQELQALSRDYESTKERHDALLRQYEAAQLAATLEEGHNVEQFRVLDAAIPPLWPSAPNRLWLLVMGLIGSAGLAFGAVVAAEKMDTSFHSADDLQAFSGVHALATVRLIATAADVRRQRRRAALWTAAFVAVLGLAVAGAYYTAAGNERLVRLTTRGDT